MTLEQLDYVLGQFKAYNRAAGREGPLICHVHGPGGGAYGKFTGVSHGMICLLRDYRPMQYVLIESITALHLVEPSDAD